MGVSLCRPSVQRRTVIDKRSRAPFVIRYNAFCNSLTTCLEWPESGRYRQGSGTVQGLRAHAPALRRIGAGFAKTQQVYIRSEFDPSYFACSLDIGQSKVQRLRDSALFAFMWLADWAECMALICQLAPPHGCGWTSETFSDQRLFARIVKGLICGSEPVLRSYGQRLPQCQNLNQS
jgi:hypothetical protein